MAGYLLQSLFLHSPAGGPLQTTHSGAVGETLERQWMHSAYVFLGVISGMVSWKLALKIGRRWFRDEGGMESVL
jgi:hypothetical protein